MPSDNLPRPAPANPDNAEHVAVLTAITAKRRASN